MSSNDTIAALMKQIARDYKKDLAPLNDNLVLINSGLDSLCFAILVAQLEDRLGVDPFTAAEDAHFPVTYGDFVRLYDKAA